MQKADLGRDVKNTAPSQPRAHSFRDIQFAAAFEVKRSPLRLQEKVYLGTHSVERPQVPQRCSSIDERGKLPRSEDVLQLKREEPSIRRGAEVLPEIGRSTVDYD